MGKCVIANRECPRTANPEAKNYCPAWSDGVAWCNEETSEEKIVHCAFEAMMPAMVQVIKASNRPASEIEATRNELAKGFQHVGKALDAAMQLEHDKS